MTPPIDWFRNPGLDKPTPPTVTPEGRIFGHIADWNTPHVGMPGREVYAPRSQHDYGYFHVGTTTALDGDTPVEVSVGHLTLDTGHAPTDEGISAAMAAAHYDNTGTVVADVCAGEDEHGIWFSGAVEPGLDELRLRKLKRSEVSGDWRPVRGGLELVAALMVNTPGFPIPRARVVSAQTVALVAAGVVPNPLKESEEMSDKTEYTLVDGTKSDRLTKAALVEITASGAIGEVTHIDNEVVAVQQMVNHADIKPASVEQALAASAARTEEQKRLDLERQVAELQMRLDAQDRAAEAESIVASVES